MAFLGETLMSLTEDCTRDLPHSMPALYHKAIEEAVAQSVKAQDGHFEQVYTYFNVKQLFSKLI